LAFLNFKVVIREFKRGYTPLKNFYPLPLIKGKGIQGIGLINNLKI